MTTRRPLEQQRSMWLDITDIPGPRGQNEGFETGYCKSRVPARLLHAYMAHELSRSRRRPRPCHLNAGSGAFVPARHFAWRATLTANFLPCVSYALPRRSALRLGFAGLVLPRFFTPRAQAAAQEKTETHGLSIFGDLAQPAG